MIKKIVKYIKYDLFLFLRSGNPVTATSLSHVLRRETYFLFKIYVTAFESISYAINNEDTKISARSFPTDPHRFPSRVGYKTRFSSFPRTTRERCVYFPVDDAKPI